MRINLSDIAEVISAVNNFPVKKTEIVLRNAFKAIEAHLEMGDEVSVYKFGTFKLRHVEGHIGNDFKTNKVRFHRDYYRPTFKPSQTLKDKVRDGARRYEADENELS